MAGYLLTVARKRRFGIIAVIAGMLVVAGVAYWHARVRPMNVILVTLDTTRADHLGMYGYANGLTEAFDQFAQQGVVFENAYAPAPITLPSHATMLTGLYPPEHGLRLNGEDRLSADIPVLPEILKQHGYETAAFVSAFVLNSKFGLNRGFDAYDDDLSKATAEAFSGERRRDGKDVMDSALSWLGLRKSKPFFCWIHLYDAHGLYDMRKEMFGQRFAQTPYDAGIAAELLQFERLTSFLKEKQLTNNTMVVVVADHGEGLDEHLENEHGLLVYNTTLRVPLVFSGAGHCQPGLRISEPVSLVDLMPTLLDLLGIPISNQVRGRSLRPALRGATIAPVPCYAEAETPFSVNRWCPLRTLISGQWKYIHTNQPELYDLKNDPSELTNLITQAADQAVNLRNRLEELQESFVRVAPVKTNLSEADIAKLSTLGYAAMNRPDTDQVHPAIESLPDVKEMLPHLVKYEKARILGLNGNFPEAIALLREVVNARNDYEGAFFLLGEFLYQAKQFDEAVPAYRSAVNLRPDHLSARISLARALGAQQKFEEALHVLKETTSLAPKNWTACFLTAEAFVALKRYNDAIAQFRKTIQLEPAETIAYIHLAQLYVNLHQLRDAVLCYEQAVKTDPGNGVAVMGLLSVLVDLGDHKQALKYAQKYAAIAPGVFEARFNLGQLLNVNGQYAEALIELREAQKLRPRDPRPAPQIQQAEAALKRSGK